MADQVDGGAIDRVDTSPGLSTDEAWQVVLGAGTPPSRTERAAVAARRALVSTVKAIPRQVQRSLIIGGVAFGLGYICNVWLLGYQYDGFRTPRGAPATGQGSRLVGSLFWMLLSAAVTSAVSYRLRVGGERFRADLFAMPGRAAKLFTDDRPSLAVNLLWGACAALVAVLLTGTALPLLGGAVLVGGLMTFARPILVGLIGFVWRLVASKIAPTRSRPPKPGALAVAGAGAMTATILAQNLIASRDERFVVAVGAGVAAFGLARRKPASVTTAALVIVGLPLLSVLVVIAPAFADDGGAIECPGRTWPAGCPGADQVLEEGLLGGLAALLGALLGDAAAGAAVEEEEEEDDDCVGGMCEGGGGDEEEETAGIDWEWVEVDPDPTADADAWKSNNPGRSLKEYDAERAQRHLEQSRKAAYAKIAEIEKLERDVKDLDARLAKMQADVDETLSSKPWGELTNAERQQTKKALISTMTQRGVPKAEIQRTVGVLESDSGMKPADLMLYVLGEIVVQTPGEAWKATGKTLSAVRREWQQAPSLQAIADATAADYYTGDMSARLADPFKTAHEYYAKKTPAQVQADFAEIAKVTGNTGLKITENGAKQFLASIDKLHEAQMNGNAPGVAQPVAKFIGGEISEELLTLGMGKALNIGKAGFSVLNKSYEVAKTKRMLTKAEALAEARRTGKAAPADIKDHVKAPHGTDIDSDAKLHDFGALPEEARAAQRVVDEEGVVLEMRPGGKDRATQLATGQVGQKGQYNHHNTVKAEDVEMGVGFRKDDVGLAGGLTDEMYEKLSDPKYLKSLPPGAQKRARERMEEFVDRADERAKLAKGKTERVPDEFSPSGRKTVVQQRVRDANGVDRHPQTGRPDTGDWDIGDIRLPDRAFFHDKFGNPLTDPKLLRADAEKYNRVVKKLMTEVSAGGTGSIRHPGGYWRPKVKITKNKKTGKPEVNCADVKTNRRINEANKLGDPNSKANLRFTPGKGSPTASYNPTGKPRYDQKIPGDPGTGGKPSDVVDAAMKVKGVVDKGNAALGLGKTPPPPPPSKPSGGGGGKK